MLQPGRAPNKPSMANGRKSGQASRNEASKTQAAKLGTSEVWTQKDNTSDEAQNHDLARLGRDMSVSRYVRAQLTIACAFSFFCHTRRISSQVIILTSPQ